MGWEERPYYRDHSSSAGGRLMWLLTGSVPLFTFSGIRVRVHASMLLVVILALLLPGVFGGPLNALLFGVGLFSIVLLHEFGHCFASRWVGGNPQEIILTPLGGVALTDAPHRPWATFVAVAGGPAVNLVICGVSGIALGLMGLNVLPFNLLALDKAMIPENHMALTVLWFAFTVSWALFLFNMLPVFPLDGGQLLQSLLWVKLGYYKATNFACITGMIGAVVMGMAGLATWHLLLVFIAISGFLFCWQLRHHIKAAGPWALEEEDVDFHFSESLNPPKTKHRKLGRWAVRRARKLLAREHAEEERIDSILAKVSAHGMRSLSWRERRTLRKATERQRQRDLELSGNR